MAPANSDMLTQLEQERISEAHRSRMLQCYWEFRTWLDLREEAWSDSCSLQVDAWVAAYLQECKDLNVPLAGHLLSEGKGKWVDL